MTNQIIKTPTGSLTYFVHSNTAHMLSYLRPNDLICSTFKVSSNLKNWGINKLRFFINASNIHPQISLILLNIVSSTIYVTFFADKCLKNEVIVLYIYALYFAEFKKNAWVLNILFSRYKHRSLSRVDHPWRQVG